MKKICMVILYIFILYVWLQFIIVYSHGRGTTWLSTLESNYQGLLLPSMGGCNLMDLDVWSHQSSMVMWAAQSQWPCSGHLLLRAWLPAQWRECLQALLPSSTGPLLEMTSPGPRLPTRLLWPSRMKWRILRKLVSMSFKLTRLRWEKGCLLGSPSKPTTWIGLCTPSGSPTLVSRTLLRSFSHFTRIFVL